MPDCGDGAANPAPREGTHLRPQARGPEAPDRARVPSPFPSHGETESGRRCAWSLGTRGCRVPPRVPEDQPPGGGSRPAGGLGPPQRGLSTCAPAGSKLCGGGVCVLIEKRVASQARLPSLARWGSCRCHGAGGLLGVHERPPARAPGCVQHGAEPLLGRAPRLKGAGRNKYGPLRGTSPTLRDAEAWPWRYRCAQACKVCTGVCGCVWMCESMQGMCRHVWVCADVCGCVRACAGGCESSLSLQGTWPYPP